jgi:hypothetical protein
MMSDQNFAKQKLTVPPWLLSGVITLADMIDMIVEKGDMKREVVEESIRLFFEVMEEKLKQGYSINLSFGTFVPSFGEPDPITGEAKLSVEFVPTKETLSLIEKKRLERLNHFSLN